jgi:hypothetical protein
MDTEASSPATMDTQLFQAHAAIAEYARAEGSKIPTDEQALIIAKGRALLSGYHARWSGENALWQVIDQEIERPFALSLVNPKTGRASKSFGMGGMLDVYARRLDTGRKLIVDHKTTSEDISDPASPYLRQLAVDAQASQYMLAKWLQNEKPDGALWDVIKKPTIAPRKLTKAELATLAETGLYCGAWFSPDLVEQVQASGRESVSMYEARLADDCIRVRPSFYYLRREVPRLDGAVLKYAADLWDHSQDILRARRLGRWPEHSGACLLYGSPCEYLGICSGHDSTDSGRWVSRDQLHPELESNSDLLTHSRVRCYQTCPAKHYYKYELRLERADRVEREALYFGSCVHAGLEAWWRFLIPNEETTING